MKSEGQDEFSIVIDPDDLENLIPTQISHRQRPSLKTTREITRFVRRYQRRLSYTPPSSPLIHALNTKNALPAITPGAAGSDNGSSGDDTEERNSNSPQWRTNKKNHDLDLSQIDNNDHRQAFRTIDMLNDQTPAFQTILSEADIRIYPKVVPQLPPIGMSSLPCRPSSPLPLQRRKRSDQHLSDASISDDEWTECKEEEEEGERKDMNEDDDVNFDKTLYFGHGDEVIKIVL